MVMTTYVYDLPIITYNEWNSKDYKSNEEDYDIREGGEYNDSDTNYNTSNIGRDEPTTIIYREYEVSDSDTEREED